MKSVTMAIGIFITMLCVGLFTGCSKPPYSGDWSAKKGAESHGVIEHDGLDAILVTLNNDDSLSAGLSIGKSMIFHTAKSPTSKTETPDRKTITIQYTVLAQCPELNINKSLDVGVVYNKGEGQTPDTVSYQVQGMGRIVLDRSTNK